VVALVHVTLPVMVIMLPRTVATSNRDYLRAAESLGARAIRAFLTVTLPLSMPGRHRWCDDGISPDVLSLQRPRN